MLYIAHSKNLQLTKIDIVKKSKLFRGILRRGVLGGLAVMAAALSACGGGSGGAAAGGAPVSPAPAPTQPVYQSLRAGAQAVSLASAGMALDQAGTIYMIDAWRQVVLKISATGVTSVLAGTDGVSGSQDGQGALAGFAFTEHSRLLIDRAGNLIVTDTCNSTVRRITPAGLVSTVAGKAANACAENSTATAESRDGAGAEARLIGPAAIALDVNGDYLVVGSGATLRRITPAGAVTTSGWRYDVDLYGAITPSEIAVGPNGEVYIARVRTVYRIQDGKANFVAGATSPFDYPPRDEKSLGTIDAMVADRAGNLYLSDVDTLRKITPDGTLSVFAGSRGVRTSIDGLGTAASFFLLGNMALDAAGNVVVFDYGNYSLRVISTGAVVTTSAAVPPSRGLIDGTGAAARFNSYLGGAADAAGNYYVPDRMQHVVRKISPAGVVTRLAGISGVTNTNNVFREDVLASPSLVASDAQGAVYIVDDVRVAKVENGVLSTMAWRPQLVIGPIRAAVTDGARNLLLLSREGVTRLDPAGKLETVLSREMVRLAGFAENEGAYNFLGIARDSAGNLYVADASSSVILKRSPAGVLSLFAGTRGVSGTRDGPPNQGQLNFSDFATMSFAPNGDMYMAGLGKVRKISMAGVISTPELAWGNVEVYGIGVANGTLLGMSGFALWQAPLP